MRSRQTGGLACVAILTVALGAAGCGSSNNSSSTKSTTTAAITKAEFLAKGNAICKKGNDQINAVSSKLFPKKSSRPTKAQLHKFATGTLIPSIQSQIDQIRALGAPAGDEAKVKALVAEAQSALDKGKKDPALLTVNGPGVFKKTNQDTKAYGLKACGGG